MNLHFDCVFYYVLNLQVAIKFYSDVLGLSLTSQDTIARFDVDGVLLELIPASDQTDFSGVGNARLCLKVDDIEQAVNELRARGVDVAAIHNVQNGRLASFADPDGNELVLWQYS
jgi:predicted enzyme related to lactoylglutathione lyase